MDFKIGDKVLVEGKFQCEILDIFDYENEKWAEVIPIWEGAIHVTREVPVSVIKLLEED